MKNGLPFSLERFPFLTGLLGNYNSSLYRALILFDQNEVTSFSFLSMFRVILATMRSLSRKPRSAFAVRNPCTRTSVWRPVTRFGIGYASVVPSVTWHWSKFALCVPPLANAATILSDPKWILTVWYFQVCGWIVLILLDYEHITEYPERVYIYIYIAFVVLIELSSATTNIAKSGVDLNVRLNNTQSRSCNNPVHPLRAQGCSQVCVVSPTCSPSYGLNQLKVGTQKGGEKEHGPICLRMQQD